MAYASRHHGGAQGRHDPARHGIFIHGGTNTQPKWEPADSAQRHYQANRFHLTLPCSTPYASDESPEMQRVRSLPAIEEATFQRALQRAVKLRRAHPVLSACPIYACTDFMLDREWVHRKGQPPSCGSVALQLVAPPEAPRYCPACDCWEVELGQCQNCGALEAPVCENCLEAYAETGFVTCGDCGGGCGRLEATHVTVFR